MVDRDPSLPMRNNDVLEERGNRPVCLELEAGVELLGRRAGDLEQDRWIERGRSRAWLVLLELAADHRTIGKRREPGRLDIQPEVRGVDAARAVVECIAEHPEDLGSQSRVLLGPACHRVDLTRKKLVLRRTRLLEGNIVRVRVAMQA